MNRRQVLKGIAGLGAAAPIQSRAAEAQHRLWLPRICAGSRWLPQNLLWSPGTIFEAVFLTGRGDLVELSAHPTAP